LESIIVDLLSNPDNADRMIIGILAWAKVANRLGISMVEADTPLFSSKKRKKDLIRGGSSTKLFKAFRKGKLRSHNCTYTRP
jgi:hypothetical protein